MENTKMAKLAHEENRCLPAHGTVPPGFVEKAKIKCSEVVQILWAVPKQIVYKMTSQLLQIAPTKNGAALAITSTVKEKVDIYDGGKNGKLELLILSKCSVVQGAMFLTHLEGK